MSPRMANLRHGDVLISLFLPSPRGQVSTRHFSLTVGQRGRILWDRPLCTFIITKAMESKPYKQFQRGVRTDFSLQQQQNIPDSFCLNNILNKNYLSMNCFKKKKKKRRYCLFVKYVHYALHLKSRENPLIKSKQQWINLLIVSGSSYLQVFLQCSFDRIPVIEMTHRSFLNFNSYPPFLLYGWKRWMCLINFFCSFEYK